MYNYGNRKKNIRTNVLLFVIALVIGIFIGYVANDYFNKSTEIENNLLKNSGFEQIIDQKTAYWFKASIPHENLTMKLDDNVSCNGTYSAFINNTHNYEEQICNNWAQTVYDIPKNEIVELSGWVKTIDAESVVVMMQFWDGNDEMIDFLQHKQKQIYLGQLIGQNIPPRK